MKSSPFFPLMIVCLLGLLILPALSQTTEKRGRTDKPKRSQPPVSWDSETEQVFAVAPAAIVKGQRPQVAQVSAESGPDTETGKSEGKFAWPQIVSADTITNEIKNQLPVLAANVRNMGSFKREVLKVKRQYATLAVMFGILAQFDESVRWQSVAPAARDAFATVSNSLETADQKAYQQVKNRYQDLNDLVRGGSVEFEKPKSKPLWSDLAERRLLMQRLETAHNERLRPLTASQAEFDKNRTQVIHEAEIIAALAEVIQQEEYEYYDDDDFLDHCKQLQQQARQVVRAASEKNLAEVQQHVGSISKSCSGCHEGYK